MQGERVATQGAGSAAPTTRDRPLPPGFVLLGAVLAMSWAGPLVRFSAAPALAIAAWRLLFSVAAIGVVLLVRKERPPLRLSAREWALAFGAGVLLAAHFWSWIESLAWTTVSSSAVLVSTQPVFVALFSTLFLREAVGARQWLGIAVAVAGAAAIGWGDLRAGAGAAPHPLLGDLLAVAGAVFAAGYYTLGRRLRQKLDLWLYVGVVYSVAAITLTLAALLSPGVRMTGYAGGEWLIFLALALGPMMVGHTGVNYALRYLPAHVANLATLGEPLGATLIAWLLPAIGEPPTVQVLAGGALIGAGLWLGARGR